MIDTSNHPEARRRLVSHLNRIASGLDAAEAQAVRLAAAEIEWFDNKPWVMSNTQGGHRFKCYTWRDNNAKALLSEALDEIAQMLIFQAEAMRDIEAKDRRIAAGEEKERGAV